MSNTMFPIDGTIDTAVCVDASSSETMSPVCRAEYLVAARGGAAPTKNARARTKRRKRTRLPWQRERVHRRPCGDGDELAAVHRVADGRGRHVAAGLEMPEMRPGFGVER